MCLLDAYANALMVPLFRTLAECQEHLEIAADGTRLQEWLVIDMELDRIGDELSRLNVNDPRVSVLSAEYDRLATRKRQLLTRRVVAEVGVNAADYPAKFFTISTEQCTTMNSSPCEGYRTSIVNREGLGLMYSCVQTSGTLYNCGSPERVIGIAQATVPESHLDTRSSLSE